MAGSNIEGNRGKQAPQPPGGTPAPEGQVTVEFLEDVQYRSVGHPEDDRDFNAGEQYDLRPDVAQKWVEYGKATYLDKDGEPIGHAPLPEQPASVRAQAIPNPPPRAPGREDVNTLRQQDRLDAPTGHQTAEDDDEDLDDDDEDEDEDGEKAASTKNAKAITRSPRDKARRSGQSAKK